MTRYINSSEINGTVCAPPSKSAMIRAVALCLLADGESIIKNPSHCTDSLAAMNIASLLGAGIKRKGEFIAIDGNNGLKKKQIKETTLNCSESGLCMRMFTPIAGLLDREIVLDGEGTLVLRPMAMVEELVKLGASCTTNQGFPPVTIKGPISSGNYIISGSESSQFLTGLMIALPLCDGDSEIRVKDLKSRPYVRMTIEMMREFGVDCSYNEEFNRFFIKGNQRYKAKEYSVEGDWSGASFMLVAGAIAGAITVTGLKPHSAQADKGILDVLNMAGASLNVENGRITVTKGELKGFEFDAEDSPDIVPPVVALAAHCEGKTLIGGIGRLCFKESNRLNALVKEFSKMGIHIHVEKERLEIEGGGLTGAVIDPHRDHRIAMACAVCALTGDRGITIENPECVAKSYPSFFDDLESIMVKR